MKRQLIYVVAAVAALAPAAAGAQGQPAAQGSTQGYASIERTVLPAQAPAVGTRIVMGAVETKITIDRPYSAEAISETVQVLGDGNRITNRSVTKVYRDSAGRTRRETLDTDGTVRTIAISDPVAKASYTLDPKTKIAYKGGGSVVMAARTPGGTYTLTPSTASGGTGGVVAGTGTGQAVAIARSGGGVGGGTLARTPAPDNPNVKTEEAGTQNIEGVSATGTRTTTTIPAGQIGNAQEIKVLSERWFSDDLQVLVLTKHSDPRSGETTYRLRNILRAEPDASLFTVPADYTVQERGR